MTAANRMGVDIGGTFVDVVLEVRDHVTSAKVLTTHAASEAAILDGVVQVCTTRLGLRRKRSARSSTAPRWRPMP